MKTKKRILTSTLLAIGLVALIATGCSKDDDSPSSSYHFTCKIDGVAFSVTKHMSDGNGSYANIGGEMINNQTDKKSSITLGAPELDKKGAGEYTPGTVNEVTYFDESGVLWHYKSGSFTISKFDAAKSEVTGSFKSLILESDGGSTKTATEGSFFVYLVH